MNLEQRLANEARQNSGRKTTTIYLSIFAAWAALATAANVLKGTLTPPMIGMNAVLLYGVYLAFQGWRQKENRISCAAMLVLPGILFAAYLVK